MTDSAIHGTVHETLPAGFEDWEVGSLYFAVIPWFCPKCEQLVAESVLPIDHQGKPIFEGLRGDLRVKTVTEFSPTRQGEVDEDGREFYGPSSRWLRGRQERRDRRRLFNASDDRARLSERSINHREVRIPRDHLYIEAATFDTICVNCPKRVRIDIAKALALPS